MVFFLASGLIEIAGMLLRHGAIVNAKDERQDFCIQRINNPDHRFKMAELLVNNGADVNARNADGNHRSGQHK